MPPAQRLVFKGPTHAKRQRKPPAVLYPIVPDATARSGKRRTRDRSDADASQVRRTPSASPEPAGPQREKPLANVPESKLGIQRDRIDLDASGDLKETEDGDEDASPVHTMDLVAYEARIAPLTIATRWQSLSAASQLDLRNTVERLGQDVLEEVCPDTTAKVQRQATRRTIRAFAEEFGTALASLAVPPLPDALAEPCHQGTKETGAHLPDIVSGAHLRDSLAELHRALEAEEAEMAKLHAQVDKQKRLLKRDRARLSD